MENDVIGLEV